jgi:NADH-quinone oxidoreductase subunit L
MNANFPLHLIPLLPLIGAAFALLVGKRLGKDATMLVCVGVVFGSFLLALRAVMMLHHDITPGGSLVDTFFDAPWIAAGDLNISAGLMLDRLSSVLVLVVTGIGFLIHVYSTAYMEHDEGFTRFFGYLNLFMGAMLILVLGDSLLVTFVGWEGVGLCSYLLIGFWFDKEAFAYAGRKAFVVNRIGDFGFLLAIFLLLSLTNNLKYSNLAGGLDALRQPLWLGLPGAFYVGVLVLVGAAGKSAQIPLYVWLPDAMAGPTPVSALIHAATMVTAGVYVVARMHVIYEVFPLVLAIVAIIGALTALFAATIGIAQRDMKKVLAYSTISQLGFMFAAVGSHLHGTSNYQAGIFHLMTHAFFKAGLFLGAGSVMHALDGEGDISRMGGLKKWLPHTRTTFLIYCLAIAGIPPFAGFWSKDAILGGAHAALWPVGPNAGGAEVFFANHLGTILYFTLLAAAGCTAFYMFRLYFLVFEGEYRGGQKDAAHASHGHGHDDHGHHEPHESPPAMTIVLWVLAAGSMLVGFLGMPDALHEGVDKFGEWLSPVLAPMAREESAGGFLIMAAIATGVSLVGIAIAWALYGRGFSPAVKNFVTAVPRLYKTVLNKYYVDEIYDFLIVRPIRWVALILWKAVDSFLIDLVLVNGVGFLVSGIGKLVKYLQNGDVQRYVVGMIIGGAALIWVASNWTAREAKHFQVRVSGSEVTVDLPSSGANAKRLSYTVDWHDGKKSGPQQAPMFRHTYESPGTKEITVEVKDPRWDTGATGTEETKKVVIK